MKRCARIGTLGVLGLLPALLCSPAARAQDDSGDSKGIESAGYNIRQSLDFGYRANWINGNQDTYDTFINLGQGVRLFDYSLDMRSINHNGLLFDNLGFSNFGYGGDPNDVSRLHMGQVVRLPNDVPPRQKFLGLESLRQSAEPHLRESRCQPDDAVCKFASLGRPRAPDAGLQFDAFPAIQNTIPVGLFAKPR
jgi:hypothetical protein